MSYLCAYFGRRDECPECGGSIPHPGERGDRFCSDDCAASYSDRCAAQDAALQARRDEEDAFAAACDRLRGEGYADEEIDRILAAGGAS